MPIPRILLLLLMFSACNSFASVRCPVDITHAQRYTSNKSAIGVEYKNVSGKEILSVALGVDMYDDDSTMKELFFELRDREQLAPGDKTEGSWTETMYDRDYPRVNVFVKKVTFADATEWKDDGSGTCNSGLAGIIAKGMARQQSVTARVVATANGHGEN